jgi:hypothetical protein
MHNLKMFFTFLRMLHIERELFEEFAEMSFPEF